ncbi:MAG: T9SS type A sorting domain-containing protein [Candidatus Eiseniibacteriota bacterium]
MLPVESTAAPGDGICGTSAPPITSLPPDAHIKALLILAEFSDQNPVASACTSDPWPASSGPGTPVPSWASELLESTWTTSIDSSLTDYFALMSRGSPSQQPAHLLEGSVYPKVVYLTTIAGYLNSGGMTQAMNDVIDVVDADPGFSFAPFDVWDAVNQDETGDGVVDFVFVLFRQLQNTSSNWLVSTDGGMKWPFSGKQVDGGALTVDPACRCNPTSPRRGYWTAIEVLAHEYGHYLTAAVPEYPVHNRAMDRYDMMNGFTALKMGPPRWSTFLRHEFGWITPTAGHDLSSGTGPLTPGGQTTITLNDVYTDGDAGFAVVRTADPDQYFILECVDSTGSMFASNVDCLDNPENSGLMIYHVAKKLRVLDDCTTACTYSGSWTTSAGASSCYPPLVEPELAGAMWDTTSHAPDPVAGFDRLSYNEQTFHFFSSNDDQFRRERGVEIMSTYTNPNTNLYWYNSTTYNDPANCAKRQEQSVYSGLTFHDIHWVTNPGSGLGEISVTIRYDGPSLPPEGYHVPDGMIWRGKVALMSDIVIPFGSLLRFDPGTQVVCAALQDVFHTGVLPDLVELQIDGALELNGYPEGPAATALFTSSRDDEIPHNIGALGSPDEAGEEAAANGGDWYGAKVGPAGAVTVTGTIFRYASGALNFSQSVFPDLGGQAGIPGITFQHNVVDVTFDRDVEVTTNRVVPANTSVGFMANLDAADLDGIDPSRIEVVIRPGGTLHLESGSILRSANGTASPGDWYGVRLPSITMFTSTGGTISHARGAIAHEASGFPLASLTGVTLSNNVCNLTTDRDYTVGPGSTLTIPAGQVVGFTAMRDVTGATNGGKDPNRGELNIAGGNLDLDGVLRSDDPTDPRGVWYGVRTTNLSKVLTLSSGGTIRNAGGALSLEGAAASSLANNPTSTYFNQFSGKVAFQSNQSDVCLDRDLEIGVGETLVLPGGWRLGFTKDSDAANLGTSTDCELIVKGTLDAGDPAGARGAITSNHAPGDPVNSLWYGIRHVEDYTTVGAGYGFFFKQVPVATSSLENLEMEGADKAISLERLAAPQIKDVNFLSLGANPANPIHIYLDSTDVVVPFEKTWSLNAATYVVAANLSLSEYNVGGVAIGDPGKVDLIVQGTLNTSGTSGNRVRIYSETRTKSGNDWGGVYMDWSSGASVIDWARISDAANSIFFYYPNGPTLKNSRITAWADIGVWMLEGYGTGATVVDCTIDRPMATFLNPLLGDDGVFIEKCVAGRIQRDTLTVDGTPRDGAAVVIRDNLNWCTFLPPDGTETLYIENNVVRGLGEASPIERAGFTFLNSCRPGSRQVLVAGNDFKLLSGPAFSADQSAGIRFECNAVDSCRQAVWFRSNGTTPGSVVDLIENRFNATTWTDPHPIIHVEHNGQSAGGGVAAITLKRDNFLEVAVVPLDDSKFVEELDAVNAMDLAAINNTWAEKSGLVSTIVTNVPAITARMSTTAPGGVAVDPPLTTNGACGGGSVSGRQSAPPDAAAGDGADATRLSSEAARTELFPGAPTPFLDRVELRFGVESPGAHVTLEVFNILGQRVAQLADEYMTGGVYVLPWNGRNGSGLSVGSGAYFVRLRAGNITRVTKLVRLAR